MFWAFFGMFFVVTNGEDWKKGFAWVLRIDKFISAFVVAHLRGFSVLFLGVKGKLSFARNGP